MNHHHLEGSGPRQQKNEVLVLIEEIDLNTYECQIGDERGRVHKSHMKIITPLNSVGDSPPPQVFSLILQNTFALCCSVLTSGFPSIVR